MRYRPALVAAAATLGMLVFARFAPLAPAGTLAADDAARYLPGRRVLVDAHNAYPYHGQWRDRIERALATGVPVAIEQDLTWICTPPGPCRSVLAHNEPFTGEEPSLSEYFFERVRPVVERALAGGDRRDWPLIVLNLDFKTDEPEHHAAVWAVLGQYESWLTTAARTASAEDIAPLDVGPVLVLTGAADAQQVSFHDRVPGGGRLRLFGAVVPEVVGAEAAQASGEPPADILPGRRTNYRRWWNNSWSVVEAGGPRAAGEWTPADAARLSTLVRRAHEAGLWIRFYTLDGWWDADGETQGWDPSYNFGSRFAAEVRWRAALETGVDFVATDQYEAFGSLRAAVGAR